MSEAASEFTTPASDDDRPVRGFMRYGAHTVLMVPTEHELDETLAKGDFRAAEKISTELIDHRREHPTTPSELYRAQLKNVALPLYEEVYHLQRHQSLGKNLLERIDTLYYKSADTMQDLIEARTELMPGESEADAILYKEVSGAISEFAFLNLYLYSRNLQTEPRHLVVPSTAHEDHLHKAVTGKRHAFDYRVYRSDNLTLQAFIQAKTYTRNSTVGYSAPVTVIGMNELAGSVFKGKYTLPRAIANVALGTPTNTQVKQVQLAARRLQARTEAGMRTV